MLLLLTGMLIIVDLMTLAFGFPAEIVQTPGIKEMKLPPGYREWKVISVAHEGGKLNDIRAILGNDVAFHASRDGVVPYPDGAMIVRLAWRYTPSEENNNVFGSKQSFVAGLATNVQLLVKDSRKFSATGGWGFAQFSNNSPTNEAVAKDCFACHTPAKHNDYVFTRYAP
jgi:hypothetical protein